VVVEALGQPEVYNLRKSTPFTMHLSFLFNDQVSRTPDDFKFVSSSVHFPLPRYIFRINWALEFSDIGLEVKHAMQ